MTKSKTSDAPRLVRCPIAGIRVQFGEGGKNFAIGDVVDLDALAAPGVTWREALGSLVDRFEAVSALQE